MPYFTFAIRGTVAIEESEPFSYPDLAAAVEDARRGAREIMADGVSIGRDRHHWVFEVRDTAGHVLECVQFGDAVTPDASPPS